eukprot:1031534-Alexandrium_andersonii.AAC.1
MMPGFQDAAARGCGQSTARKLPMAVESCEKLGASGAQLTSSGAPSANAIILDVGFLPQVASAVVTFASVEEAQAAL